MIGTHVGGPPANPPLFSVFRFGIAVGTPSTIQTLNSGDTPLTGIGPSPATGAAWYNGGLLQQFTYTCNQHQTVDAQNYGYAVMIQDENGANSQASNQYVGQTLAMTVGQLAYA